LLATSGTAVPEADFSADLSPGFAPVSTTASLLASDARVASIDPAESNSDCGAGCHARPAARPRPVRARPPAASHALRAMRLRGAVPVDTGVSRVVLIEVSFVHLLVRWRAPRHLND